MSNFFFVAIRWEIIAIAAWSCCSLVFFELSIVSYLKWPRFFFFWSFAGKIVLASFECLAIRYNYNAFLRRYSRYYKKYRKFVFAIYFLFRSTNHRPVGRHIGRRPGRWRWIIHPKVWYTIWFTRLPTCGPKLSRYSHTFISIVPFSSNRTYCYLQTRISLHTQFT